MSSDSDRIKSLQRKLAEARWALAGHEVLVKNAESHVVIAKGRYADCYAEVKLAEAELRRHGVSG